MKPPPQCLALLRGLWGNRTWGVYVGYSRVCTNACGSICVCVCWCLYRFYKLGIPGYVCVCVCVCVFMIDVVQSIGIQFIMYIKGMKGIFLYDGLNWSGDLHTHTYTTHTHTASTCVY